MQKNRSILTLPKTFVWWFFLLIGLTLSSPEVTAVGGAVSRGPIGPIFGAHRETVEDIRVKVLGDHVLVTRSWDDGKWYINRRWSPLVEVPCQLSVVAQTARALASASAPCGIMRNDAKFNSVAGNTYQQDNIPRETIIKTATGYRWQDRNGNWIDYQDMRPIAYGDRNNVKVNLHYDAEKNLTGVFDHLDKQILWYEYTDNQISAIRDYTNRRVEYRYTAGKLTTVIDVRGHTWTYTYEGEQLKTKTDPEGKTTTISYGSGAVTSILHEDGTGTFYKHEYDKTKREFYKQEKTSAGTVTETWYDSEGDVLRTAINGTITLAVTKDGDDRMEKDQRGNQTVKDRDEWENVLKLTYADGASINYTYDPVYSNVTQKTDERGIVTRYEYDSKGNLTRQTEAVGNPEQRIMEYTYDQYGQRLTESRLGDAVTAAAVTRYEYDDYGNVTAMIDTEGHRTEHTQHDVMGNILVMKDARQKLWKHSYDHAGNLSSETDPLNHVTVYTYDKAGLRTQVTDAAGNKTLYDYDVRNNIKTVTDPYGGITRFDYDADNRLIKQTDQTGKSITTDYDLDGRVSMQTDGNGNVTRYVYGDELSGLDKLLVKVIYPTFTQEFKYDARDRVTEVIDVLDASTRRTVKTAYDRAGNETSRTDQEGKTTRYTYDALGRLNTLTDPANGITDYGYDNRDNLISVKDPKQQTHRFEYDKRNLKLKETRPLGQAIVYTYDATGNASTLIDPKGQVKSYSHDDAGRTTGEQHFPSAADLAANDPAKSITYGYNTLDELIAWSDSGAQGNTAGTLTYDTRQLRKTGESVDYGSFNLTYAYSHYANGLKKSFTGPDGVEVAYSYDANNQLTTIQLPVGSVTVNQYRWQVPGQITFPGGTTRTQSHDSLLRLKTIQVKDSLQNDLLNHQYDYDEADNIKEKITQDGTTTYTYDDLYRLTQATNPSPLLNETYAYDPVGNRLTDSNVPGDWHYNANNQLTTHGAMTHSFDANGNTQSQSEGSLITTYSYDISDRLIEITQTDTQTNTTATVARYAYDPLGRRLWKEVNNQKTYFFYADEGLVAEANNAGDLTRLYGFAPDSVWTTDPVYLKEGSNYYFYQNDHLGTPQQLLDTSGHVVWSARAQAFGETLVENGSTVINNLRFPGQYEDEETGRHYNYFRDYDPTLGRYLTSDPIGLEGGLNIFSYAEQNPISNTDPDGLIAKTVIGCIKNPKKCRKDVCNVFNKLAHVICDSARSCKGTDSCIKLHAKKAHLQFCFVMRISVRTCHGRKNDPNPKGHEQAVQQIKNRIDNCRSKLKCC